MQQKRETSRAEMTVQPPIVVQDGKPIDCNLRGERITIDDPMEEARAKGIERLDEIRIGRPRTRRHDDLLPTDRTGCRKATWDNLARTLSP
jgi:hypothetical protein